MGSRIVRLRLPVVVSVFLAPCQFCANFERETLLDMAAQLRSDRRWLQEQRNFGSPFAKYDLLLTIGLE
jgi:hypothetical protein